MFAFLLVASTLQAMAGNPNPCAISVVMPSQTAVRADYPAVDRAGQVTGTAELGPNLYLWIFVRAGANDAKGRAATGLPASLEFPASNRAVSGRWIAKVRYRTASTPGTGLSSIWVIAVDENTNHRLTKTIGSSTSADVFVFLNDVTPTCEAGQTVRTGVVVRAPDLPAPDIQATIAPRRNNIAPPSMSLAGCDDILPVREVLAEAERHYEQGQHAHALERYKCVFSRLSRPQQQELQRMLPVTFWESPTSLADLAQVTERAHTLFGQLDRRLRNGERR